MNELIYSINKEEINEYILKGQNLLKEINEFLIVTHNSILDNITDYIETEICNFEILRPLYYIMRLPIIREWHWIALINTVYVDLPVNERPNYKTITLMKFSEENPKSFTDFINNEIHKKALEENEIEKKLSEIDYQLKNIDFEFFLWDDFNILFLMNIIELISDLNGIIIMSDYLIKNKKNYINHFLDRIDELKSYVKSIESSLKLILGIQELLPTLAKLFSFKEFTSKLISESRNFQRIANEISNLNSKIQNLKSILIIGEKDSNQKLNSLRKEIEEIHHKSMELIQVYRKSYPRFIFLSDENLLLFISNCKNYELISKYMNQCFNGINKFVFVEKGKMNKLKRGSLISQEEFNRIDQHRLSSESSLSELKVNENETLSERKDKNSEFYKPSSDLLIIGVENNIGEKLIFSEENKLFPMEQPKENEDFYKWLYDFERNINKSLKISLRNNLIKRLNEGIEIYFKEDSFNCQFIEIIEKSLLIEYIRYICTSVSIEEKDKISFTVSCEKKFNALLNSLEKEILKIQAYLNKSHNIENRSNFNKLDTLILVLLYNRELIKYLLNKMIYNFSEFEIISLLKPQISFDIINNGKIESLKMYDYISSQIFMKNFLESEELCYIFNRSEDFSNIVECTNVKFELLNLSINYGYELNSQKFCNIIHPFRDRFIFNFCISLTNNFYFITAGSRSSGKTNTIMEIVNTLGKTVVVLNVLSSNNTYSNIASLLKASAQNGYYFFIDNINNVSNPIISSLLQGLICIRNAIFDRSYTCLIDFDQISINQNFSFLSTFTLHENIISEKSFFSESIKNKSFIFENLPKNIFEHFRIFYIFSPNYDYILKILFNWNFLCDKTDYLKKYSDISPYNIKKLNFSQFTNSKAEEYCDKILLFLRLLEKNITEINGKDYVKMMNNIKKEIDGKPQNIFLSLTRIKMIFRRVKDLYLETKANETEKSKMVNLNHIFAKAIYLTFESILTLRSEQVFSVLLSSLFDVNLDNIKNEVNNSILHLKLKIALAKQLKAMNLEVLDKQVNGIYKLVEMIKYSNSRSFLIVGDPIVGKSTSIELASKLLIDLFYEETISNSSEVQINYINLYNLNLNILTEEKLFGKYLPIQGSNSKKWKEGIIKSLFKTICQETNNLGNDINSHCVRKIYSGNIDQNTKKSLEKNNKLNYTRKNSKINSLICVNNKQLPLESWVVFDYTSEKEVINDINPQFENLSMLLEERPFINMENGEFASLNMEKTRIFFESNKIDNISPSFLSRIQIIYMSNDTITCKDIFNNYIDKKFINIYAQQKALLISLYSNLFLPFLRFCREELKNEVLIHLSDKVLTCNLITFYDIFLYEYLKQLIVIEKINVSSIEQNSINQKFSFNSISKASAKQVPSNDDVPKNKSFQSNSLFKKGTFRSIKSIGSDKKDRSITNEQLIEALMINFITKILGPIITKYGQKLACKYIVQLIDNYIRTKKDKEIVNLNKEKNYFAGEIFHLKDFPDSLFDFYYEITEFCWIRLIDYPHYDTKLNNFKGKVNIEELKVTVSHKNFDNSNSDSELLRLNPKLKQLHTDQKMLFSENLYIPTSNFVKCADLLNLSISYYLPILIIGPESSGKSYTIKNKLLIESEKNILRSIQYNCNSIQSVTEIQNLIQRYLESKYNGIHSSPGKQITYIFLDDVNMSKCEPHISNSNPLELVREWCNFGGWYDEKLPCFNEITGISFICNYSYQNHGNTQMKLVPGFSDRNLKNFFIIFFSDLTKEDFLNIFKSQYSNECMGTNIKDNFANLLLIDQFTELWYSYRLYTKHNTSNNFNLSINNVCNLMKSFKVFDIRMYTNIEELLDIWITIFKYFYVKPLSIGPTSKSFYLLESFIEKNKDLLIINRSNTHKSVYDIHVIRENELHESDCSVSERDNSSENSYDKNFQSSKKNVKTKLTKNVVKSTFDNCLEIFDSYKDSYYEKYNLILSDYKFLENSKKILMYNDNLVNKRRANLGKAEIEEFNTKNEETIEMKKETTAQKINSGNILIMNFSKDHFRKIEELIDEFLKDNYFNYYTEVKKYDEKFNEDGLLENYLFYNEKNMIFSTYFFLKSLSFLQSPLYYVDYFIKNFNHLVFFNSFYLNQLKEDSQSDKSQISEMDINESFNDYSSKYCRMTNKNQYNDLVDYFIGMVKKNREMNKIKSPSIKFLEDNIKYYISTYMNNILDLNMLMDFENNTLFIKHANYIDGTFISFFIQHLSFEKKIEFKYMKLTDFKMKIDYFNIEMLKNIEEILQNDKCFLYCIELDNYHTEDKLAETDIENNIERIISTLFCLKMKMGTEIFSLKRVKEYTDKVRLPENVIARDKNFEYLLTMLYEKISQNLKLVFVFKDNKLYDYSEFHFNSREINFDRYFGKLFKTYFKGFSGYYFDYDVLNPLINEENSYLLLNDLLPNNYNFIRNIYSELLSAFNEEYLTARKIKMDNFFKVSFEEVFYKFNHQKEIILNMFKAKYTKTFSKELQIYKYINLIERYRLKKERKLNKLIIILEALQNDRNSKEEELKILMESFQLISMKIKLLEECKELKAIYNRYNNCLDILLTSTTNDTYEEFINEFGKKTIPKVNIKIFQFIDTLLKLSTKPKASLSQEDRIVFLREFSNFNSLKELLKTFKIFNHNDKIEYLTELCSESSSKIGPFARNIMTLLINGSDLLKETVKKEELIKQYLECYNINLIQLENDYLRNYDENLRNLLEKLNTLENEKSKLLKIIQEINIEFNKNNDIAEKIKKSLKFYNKFYTKNKYILQTNNYSLNSKQDTLEELNKSAIYYSINHCFILTFPNEYQKLLLNKLCEIIYGDKCFFTNNIIPSICEGYIFKIIGFSSIFHETYLNAFLNLEILLDIISQTLYIIDPLDLVSKYLMKTRPKRTLIESHTTCYELKDKIVNCLENGNLLVIRDIDNKIYELIQPILTFLSQKYKNQLEKNLGKDSETLFFCEKNIYVHSKFKLILIDSIASKLSKIYLKENVHFINFSNSSTNSLNQDILLNICSTLNIYKIYESRILSFSYNVVKSTQRFLTNIFINVFEKHFTKDNLDMKEISKILDDKFFISDLNVINDSLKTKSHEVLLKIKGSFPNNELIKIYTRHSYKLLKIDISKLNKNIENLKELFTNSDKILNNMHDALLILRNNFKDTYYYSDYWVFESIMKISSEYATKSKQIFFQLDEIKESIKFIASEFLCNIYYSLRGNDYNLFGFILCLVRIKENCSNEDEYICIKDFINILFNNKVRDESDLKIIMKELYNINYIIPDLMNNYTINVMLDFISQQKGKNSETSQKPEEKNLSSPLKMNMSAKKNIEPKKKEENRESIYISSEEIEKLSSLSQDNAPIVKAILTFIPDFLNQFSKVVSLQEPSVKNFLGNNFIEDILNNIEFSFDETLMKLFTSLQRFVFTIALKCELLNVGMRIYTNEYIKQNNQDVEKEKIHRFFRNKFNILKIIYDGNSKYPVDKLYEYGIKYGKEIESYSVGYSESFMRKARFINNKLIILENFHLIDDDNLKLILKKIYQLYLTQIEESEKKRFDSSCLDIVLLIENSQYNIKRYKRIIKLTHFSNFLHINPKTNIKSLISDDYKQMEIFSIPNNSTLIRSNFFNRLNFLKDKYNSLYKKYLSNNYICHSLLFIKAVLSLRNYMSESKNRGFYIPRYIENNFDDFFLVQQIFFETICNLPNYILENNDSNNIKRLILNNIIKVLIKVLSVDNEIKSQNNKYFLKDLVDFCLRRMEDHQIIVYSSYSYTFPGKKDYDLKEIREHILTYLPNFDHPFILGLNRNLVLKREMENSVNNFKNLHNVLKNLFTYPSNSNLIISKNNFQNLYSSNSNRFNFNYLESGSIGIKNLFNFEKAIEIDLKYDLRILQKKSSTNVIENENNKIIKITSTLDKYTFLSNEMKELISVFHEFDENFNIEFSRIKLNYYDIEKKIYNDYTINLTSNVNMIDLLEIFHSEKLIYIIFSNSSRLVNIINMKRIFKTIIDNTPEKIEFESTLLMKRDLNHRRIRSAERVEINEDDSLGRTNKKRKLSSSNKILSKIDFIKEPCQLKKNDLNNIHFTRTDYETIYGEINTNIINCSQNIQTLMNINILGDHILEILTKIFTSINNDEIYNLNTNDLLIVNCIKNNIIPSQWLGNLNIDPTENLIDWFMKFIKKFDEFKPIETNINLLWETFNRNSQNGNIFNSIFNMMIKFSIKKKISINKISFKANYKIGIDLLNHNDEGLFLSSIILKNCYYDINSDRLIEEKYKNLHQSLPTLYLVPEMNENRNKHIVIRIVNDSKKKNKQNYNEEQKSKTKYQSKKNVSLNDKKIKSFAKISFLLRSKLTDLIDKTQVLNEPEQTKLEENLINNNPYSNIKVRQTINTLNNEEQSILNKVNQNITPFKYNTEDYNLNEVIIPLVTSFKKNNGSQFMIYLNFKSNEKQLYWDSVGAYAMLKN